MPFPYPHSRNIVSTVNLGCKLDLKNIALHARNAEYNPKVGSTHCMAIGIWHLWMFFLDY